jgi:hypothetical protein
MEKTVQIQIIRDDGQTMLYNSATTLWGIEKIDGIGSPEIEIYDEDNAIGDGSTITAVRVKKREWGFTVSLKSPADNDAQRKAQIAFYRPHSTYKAVITYRGVQRWLPCRLVSADEPVVNIYDTESLEVKMVAPDPFFRSMDEFGKDIANIIGLFGFPYVSIMDKGFRIGYYEFADNLVIENDGDADTDFRVRIVATGDVTNPKISCNGQFAQYTGTMAEGDVLIFDFQEHKVTKNGANVIASLSDNSTLTKMSLVTGSNTIKYEAEIGGSMMNVYVYFNKKFNGV